MNSSNHNNARPWKAPFMPWFEGDFSGSFNVRNMAPQARLMYRSLLQQAWHSDDPPYLPNDDATLRLMADAPSARIWNKFRGQILARFQETDDGKFLFHHKSLEHYNRVIREHDGKVAGGQQRWQGEHKDSRSTAPAARVQADTAPLSIQNHNQSQSISISATTPSGSRALLTEEDAANPDQTSQPDAHPREDLVGKICRIHPRLQKEILTEQYIFEAAQKEIERGLSAREALEYLLDRTRLYREMTDQWPDDQNRYIVSSHEFFRAGEYRTDPKFWKKGSSGGEQPQGALPSSIPEPVSKKIEKQREAERETVRSQTKAGVNL